MFCENWCIRVLDLRENFPRLIIVFFIEFSRLSYEVIDVGVVKTKPR